MNTKDLRARYIAEEGGGGYLDTIGIKSESYIQWLEKKIISDGCKCPIESTDVYDEHGNLLGFACLGCGYFNPFT